MSEMRKVEELGRDRRGCEAKEKTNGRDCEKFTTSAKNRFFSALKNTCFLHCLPTCNDAHGYAADCVQYNMREIVFAFAIVCIHRVICDMI